MRQSSLMKYSLLGIGNSKTTWQIILLKNKWDVTSTSFWIQKTILKIGTSTSPFLKPVNKLDKISDKQVPNRYRLALNKLRDHSICPAFSIYIGSSEIFCIRSSSFITEIKGFTRYVASLKFKYLWKVYKTDRVRAIFQYTILRMS